MKIMNMTISEVKKALEDLGLENTKASCVDPVYTLKIKRSDHKDIRVTINYHPDCAYVRGYVVEYAPTPCGYIVLDTFDIFEAIESGNILNGMKN